jgi:hypothetical protein
MLFQNIVKRKEKFLEPPYVKTTFQNEGCSAGVSYMAIPTPRTYLQGTGGDALTVCTASSWKHLGARR